MAPSDPGDRRLVTFTERDMLRYASVPGRPRVHVVGCLERPVTIYCQQVRALNIVQSLFRTRRLSPSGRLLVVGGGFAGVTAAIAAARAGAEVVLLEKNNEVLGVQKDSARWIHPTILEWPHDSFSGPGAELPPFADWKAGIADDVNEQLRTRLERQPGVSVVVDVSDVGMNNTDSGQWCHWREPSSPMRAHENFDQVIVATGFGQENATTSYWADDDLEEDKRDGRGLPTPFLVAGIGDGGLIDTLRLRLGRANKADPSFFDWLQEDFLPAAEVARADIADVEQQLEPHPLAVSVAARTTLGGALAKREKAIREQIALERKRFAQGMQEAYARIIKAYPAVWKSVLGRLRTDTSVVLVGRLQYPLDPGASALNRFLAAILMDCDQELTYIEGEFRTANGVDSVVPAAAADSPNRIAEKDLSGYKVIRRLGPEHPSSGFVADVLEMLAAKQTVHFDAARTPLWRAAPVWEER